MTASALAAPSEGPQPVRRLATRLRETTFTRSHRRALTSYLAFVAIWQLGATSTRWLGHAVPVLSTLPPPSAVLATWSRLIVDRGYWHSWLTSFVRVAGGFSAAVVVGVPFGLAMAMSRRFRALAFPVFELLRPVPPLAWVPAAIIFWPTQELSIDFVIFLGAFYTIVLNVLGGAEAMDPRLIQVARSMGASRWKHLPSARRQGGLAVDPRRHGRQHRHNLGGRRGGRDDLGWQRH